MAGPERDDHRLARDVEARQHLEDALDFRQRHGLQGHVTLLVDLPAQVKRRACTRRPPSGRELAVTVAAVFLLCLAVLAVGYRVYGGLLARRFGLDARADTPAHRFEDGNDYVPIPRWYLLGQHFSAISAAGPIVGPIQAAIYFGWLPALLWILLGSVFIGAMHDFSALVGSVRHRAQSVAEIV